MLSLPHPRGAVENVVGRGWEQESAAAGRLRQHPRQRARGNAAARDDPGRSQRLRVSSCLRASDTNPRSRRRRLPKPHEHARQHPLQLARNRHRVHAASRRCEQRRRHHPCRASSAATADATATAAATPPGPSRATAAALAAAGANSAVSIPSSFASATQPTRVVRLLVPPLDVLPPGVPVLRAASLPARRGARVRCMVQRVHVHAVAVLRMRFMHGLCRVRGRIAQWVCLSHTLKTVPAPRLACFVQ